MSRRVVVWTESDLKNEAADGIEEAVTWHTVGIVADQPRGIGTGTAVLWRGHPLILTACHVVKENPTTDLWFFFRAQGTLKRGIPEEVARIGELQLSPRSRIEIHKCHHDKVKDIAALEVSLELEKSHNLRFYDLGAVAAIPTIGATVVMIGYPDDITRFVSRNQKAVFPSSQWSRRVKRRGPLKDFHPRRSFLVAYPSAEIGRDPGGFSGCGVWFHESVSKVWHPNLQLAGLCTSCYPENRMLEILKVDAVRGFLEDVLP